MLTDVKVRTAKPSPKPYKLRDAQGLYIEVSPSGGKLWRLKYRLAGKEKLLALGRYPETSLARAREAPATKPGALCRLAATPRRKNAP